MHRTVLKSVLRFTKNVIQRQKCHRPSYMQGAHDRRYLLRSGDALGAQRPRHWPAGGRDRPSEVARWRRGQPGAGPVLPAGFEYLQCDSEGETPDEKELLPEMMTSSWQRALGAPQKDVSTAKGRKCLQISIALVTEIKKAER